MKSIFLLTLFLAGLSLSAPLPTGSVRRLAVPLPTAGNGFYTGLWHYVKTGDLDGDGKMEFVFVNQQWQMWAMDDLGVCTTAVSPAATRLWIKQNPAGVYKFADREPGFQNWKDWHAESFGIWDLDNDGKAEVINCWRLPDSQVYLCIFDGMTGGLLSRSPYPIDSGQGWTNKGFNVGPANFRGLPRANDVYFCNDGYDSSKIIAYAYHAGDTLLQVLWHHTNFDSIPGQNFSGHQGHPWDTDGDGKDEFVSGGVLDHDGTPVFSYVSRYSARFGQVPVNHCDNSFAADIDYTLPGPEILLAPCAVQGALPNPTTLFDVTGAVLCYPGDSTSQTLTHPQQLAIGNFRRDVSGLEHMEMPDGNLILQDNAGRTLSQNIIARGLWTFIGGAMDWDGDRSQDEFCYINLMSDTVTVYAFYDTVYDATHNGYVELYKEYKGPDWTYSHVMDLLGDYREEVVYLKAESLIILQNQDPNPYGPYPSPALSEKYLIRFQQQGEGGAPYRPYWEYAPHALTVLTPQLRTAYQSLSYHTRLEAHGGTGSYAWSLASGALPAGLTLAPDGSITGSPAARGSTSLVFRVTDGSASMDTAMTLLVAPGLLSISLSRDTILLTNKLVALQATGHFSNDSTTLLTGCNWASSNDALVMVNALGKVYTLTPTVLGQSWVYAEKQGTRSDSCLVITTGVGVEEGTGIPEDALEISPNPFNPTVNFHFSLKAPGKVEAMLYDVRGALVAELVSGEFASGIYRREWNGTDRASGIYFLKVMVSRANRAVMKRTFKLCLMR